MNEFLFWFIKPFAEFLGAVFLLGIVTAIMLYLTRDR